MKNLKLFAILGITALSIISACKKEDASNPSTSSGTNNNNNNNSGSGAFSAKLNGTLFSTNNVQAAMNDNVLEIYAISGKSGFRIAITNPKIGNNVLSSGGFYYLNAAIYVLDTTEDVSHVSVANSIINITKLDASTKTATASFEIIMEDTLGNTMSVTSGSFNINYAIKGWTISYTLDGVSKTTTVYSTVSYTYDLDSLGNEIDVVPYVSTITEHITSYPIFGIRLPKAIQAGTYEIKYSTALPSFFFEYRLSSDEYYEASEDKSGNSSSKGTLIISKNSSGNMTGTFAVTLDGLDPTTHLPSTKTVTNGSFDVKY